MDKRRFWLFILGFVLGSVLSVSAQDTTIKPEAVLVPETQDKMLLEIEPILAEELKQVSPEWKNSLFTEENVNLIKMNVRKALPQGAGDLSENGRKALIRKTVRDTLYSAMKNVVMKGAEASLLEQINALPWDWRDLALTEENIGKILQQATGDMDFNLLNLPRKERDAALLAKLKQEIIKFQQAMIMTDAEGTFSEAFNQWPETLKTKVDAAQTRAAVKLLVDAVLQKSAPGMARKDINLIIQKEVSASLFRLMEMLVDAELMNVIAQETGKMSPKLTDVLVIDEKVFKGLIDEMRKTLFQNIGTASAQKDPLLLYKAATEKIVDVVQKIFMREREKFAGQCMKENVPESVALDQEKYWLMFPLPEQVSKEHETFPYIDERYYTCKAVAENNLAYCDKFMIVPGREEHDVACRVHAFLYLRLLPSIVGAGSAQEDIIQELSTIDPTTIQKKNEGESLLRALAEKNASYCEPLKEKDDNWYRVCRSAINRNQKACAGAAYSKNCEQNALALEAVLYNDDTKIKGIAFADIVSPLPLLSKLYFDKTTCSRFYEEEIKKRYCYNLYMYKPFKEVKKDEKEKKKK